MPYVHTTFSQLKAALLARLGDSVFWTDDTAIYSEVGSYLQEALRVWAAAAHFWKDRVPLSLRTNVAWYDLRVEINALAYTVSDRQVLSEIQYHFLEPLNQTGWSGSDQFTLDEIVAAIERRRNQFLDETSAVLAYGVLPVSPPPAEGRFELPANFGPPVIDIRRLCWISLAGLHNVLWRDDEMSVQAFSQILQTNPDTPNVYSISTTAPLKVQLFPAPNDKGYLELLAVQNGAPLDVVAGVSLGVPDNLAWVVKYGAMADLLGKDGPARDPERATYCERRWREGVELAKLYPQVLLCTVTGRTIIPTSVRDLDAFSPGWQDRTPAIPEAMGLTGGMVAFSAPPDTAYNATLDVLMPAPIPSTGAGMLQLGPEELGVILDYAQHVAMFKQGGPEFMETVRQYENLVRLAAQHNEKLPASSALAAIMRDREMQEDKRRPPSTTAEKT